MPSDLLTSAARAEVAYRLRLGAALRRRASVVHQLLDERLQIAKHGCMEAAGFRAAWSGALERGDDATLGGPLLRALLVELWLRARSTEHDVQATAISGVEVGV